MRPRSTTFVAALAVISAVGCADNPPTTPLLHPQDSAALDRSRRGGGGGDDSVDPTVVTLVRQLAVGRNVVPLDRAPRVRQSLVNLGQALLFDPILSGNRNISCATCHLPAFATGDGKSLAVGEGGNGLGPDRQHPNGVFIPRNAPPLFNLGVMDHLFWDGRVEQNGRSVHTPAGAQVSREMERVFEFGPASALGLFPVTSREEMRGQRRGNSRDNELAAIDDDNLPEIWEALMRRLGRIPQYRSMFEAAYPGTDFRDMTFAHASNAIGAFMISAFTFSNTPWDRFLRGDDRALTSEQLAGAQTFLTIKCSICHNGATQSDDQFHNVAIAQLGPGKGDGPDGRDDFGRMEVTGDPLNRYQFRTTPLRNVELTGPYGHDGAFLTLRGFIEHYSESDVKLRTFDASPLEPRLRNTVIPTTEAILAQRDTIIAGVVLTPEIVDQLMDYMSALTDPAARDLSRFVPFRVPSGLPVDRPRNGGGGGGGGGFPGRR